MRHDKLLKHLAILALLLLPCVCGCSADDGAGVFAPDAGMTAMGGGSRCLWGNWIISLDENTGADVAPMRIAGGHFNVIGFLELWPCTSCLRVTNLDWQPGYVDVTVQLRHPFTGMPYYSGFDVRGICFLPGTFESPGMAQTMPDFETENYVAAIPGSYMGYTDLFNPVTSPDGLPFGYAQGKLTPWPKGMLTSKLGAFHYFASYPDGGKRNVFETYDVINAVYRIVRNEPGPIVYGYSVDASWTPPFEKPVIVPDSFTLTANCLEAWKIVLEVDDLLLTEDGGYLDVLAVAYDHQGIKTLADAWIECPDLHPSVIVGTIVWEDEPNQCRAYEFSVPNTNLTAVAGDKAAFLVRVNPMEDLALFAFAAGTATVHAGGGECPPGVHKVYYGKGEFGQFGNFTIPPTDAAITTAGDFPGQFIMFGNGFAGSMMGCYDISDLGPHEPNGLVGLVGLGAPTSLDVSPVHGNMFLVMPLYGGSQSIQPYRADGEELTKIDAPNAGAINSVDVTPGEEIWFIEQVGNLHYLHHAVAKAEWNWQVIPLDSRQILSDLPTVPHIFDLIYEPKTKRIYVYHEYTNGSIDVYDASLPGPPVDRPDLSKQAIWGYSGPLEYIDGGFYCTGADIELDLVDAALSDCRIVVFANFELGGSAFLKLDADMNYLDMTFIGEGPYSSFAISIDPDMTKRRLVFLPLEEFADDYYLYDPPSDW